MRHTFTMATPEANSLFRQVVEKQLAQAAKMQRATPKRASELRIQLPQGVTMDDKVQEHDVRLDDHAGRLQSLETGLADLRAFVHGGFTRGNLLPPQPADPEHDNAVGTVTYECTNPGVIAIQADGTRVRTGGCGARTTKEFRLNQDSIPAETPCPVCGTIARRVEEDDEKAQA